VIAATIADSRGGGTIATKCPPQGAVILAATTQGWQA